MIGADIAEAAGRLEAQIQPPALLADDPLAPVLRESAALARAMSETIERLEKLGSNPLDAQVVAAVERASKAIAFRIAGNIDRRISVIIAAALMSMGVIGGAIGYAIGAAEAGRGRIAVCWQYNGARVCAPAVWLKPGG